MKVETRLKIGDIIYRVEDKYDSTGPVKCTGCDGKGFLEVELLDGRKLVAKCPACVGTGSEPQGKSTYIVCKYTIVGRIIKEDIRYDTKVEYRIEDSDTYQSFFVAILDEIPDDVFINEEDAKNKIKELNK